MCRQRSRTEVVTQSPLSAAAPAAHKSARLHGGRLLLWLSWVVIGALTALVLRRDHEVLLAHHAAQLEAVTELQAKQVERWLEDRLSLARYASSTPRFVDLSKRFRDAGDLQALDVLIDRVGELNQTLGGRSVLLLDAQGAIIASDAQPRPAMPAQLQAAALRAIASGEIQLSGIHAAANDADREWLDIVAPLVGDGRSASSAVVLRFDPNDQLLATLQVWPVPSPTAQTALVRRQGDRIIGMSERTPFALSTPDLLSARAIRGAEPFGKAFHARDSRGEPVYGAVRPVRGADWFIVAQVSRKQLHADALDQAWPVIAVGMLVLLGSVLASVWLRTKGSLEAARMEHALVVQRADEMRRLGLQLNTAEDRERRRIAHDLHDGLAQTLAAARIRLAALCEDQSDAVRTAARTVDGLLASANVSTRSLASQLAPPVLDQLGLGAALEWLAEEIERTYCLTVQVLDDGEPKPLSQQTRSILYRATRELLINVAKHARCDAAVVQTRRDGERIIVSVSDDGIGFDAKQVALMPRHGMGLATASERLLLIGGTAELLSKPGEGTLGVLSAPLGADESETLKDIA